MSVVERGTIQRGQIVLEQPLSLADGTAVLVKIDAATGETAKSGRVVGEFESQGFFGLWADRAEMGPAAEWHRQERGQWHSRASRQD